VWRGVLVCRVVVCPLNQTQASAKFMLELDPLVQDFWQQEIVAHITQLWTEEKAIKEMYAERAKLQLLDSTE
jgi:hypothetical protein